MPIFDPVSNTLRTLTWAVYLGCSWTWCIGMFLPVILVSEFGNLAWFIFAIPNVIGAAAMGWVLAKPGSSERMVAEHRAACVWFTAVTFAFHLFFLYWLTSIGLIPRSFAIIAMTTGVLAGFIARWKNGVDSLLGWAVLGISLAVLIKGLAHPVFGLNHAIFADQSRVAMIGLAVACLFGFLLCPYLDVTFHRARQMNSPAGGKAAFGIGFGIVFLAMIVLTMLYVGDFARDRLNRSVHDSFGSYGADLLITWVALHIAAQTGFTFTAHIRALPTPRRGDLIIWAVAAALLTGAIFAVAQEQWFTVKQLGIAMLSGQLMYQLFTSFYGLVFPSYVWMFIVPIAGRVPAKSSAAIATWIASMAIAAPMFWLGFVNQWMLWLIPAVIVLLAARIVSLKREKSELLMFNEARI